MIEELPETKLLSVTRISLSDFVPPLCVSNGLVLPQHPSTHFRNQRGFYVCQRFCGDIGRHLSARNSQSRAEFLFVNSLKRDCLWRTFVSLAEGARRPVPWWVIKPFLWWQQSRPEGTLLPSNLVTVFLMEFRDEEDNGQLLPVSLSLRFGLHSEWYLDVLDTDGGDLRCSAGQVFLAVA